MTDSGSDVPNAAMIVPTDYAYVGLVFRGTMRTLVDARAHTTFEAPVIFIGGSLDEEWVYVNYSARYGQILAEFNATGLYELLHLDGKAVAGIACTVEALGLSGFATLKSATSQIRIGESMAEMLADTFQETLCALVPQAKRAPEYVRCAVEQFEAANGLVKIKDVAQLIGVKPDRLRRQFHEIVGLRPKRFLVALMINQAMENLVKGKFASLTEVAHEAGYHDQAHFILAVRKMVRQNPRAFLTSRRSFPDELFVRNPRQDIC